jgi:hypothetical protein
MTMHSFIFQFSIRTSRTIAAGLAISSALMVNAGAAIDLSTVERATGPWEMALHDTERRCAMRLRADKAPGAGHVISMPAGCRRALPILMDVTAWSVSPDRTLEFDDKSGSSVLSFAANDRDSLSATGPEGETYELLAPGRKLYAQASPTTPAASGPAIRTLPQSPNPAGVPAGAAQPPQQAQQSTRQSAQAPLAAKPVSQAPGPTTAVKPFVGKASELSGRYMILRESGKDIGCMLTLNDQGRGPAGSQRAQLAPACRDNGIVVFDPQGWQLDRGRIALTARKGHKAHFERPLAFAKLSDRSASR